MSESTCAKEGEHHAKEILGELGNAGDRSSLCRLVAGLSEHDILAKINIQQRRFYGTQQRSKTRQLPKGPFQPPTCIEQQNLNDLRSRRF